MPIALILLILILLVLLILLILLVMIMIMIMIIIIIIIIIILILLILLLMTMIMIMIMIIIIIIISFFSVGLIPMKAKCLLCTIPLTTYYYNYILSIHPLATMMLDGTSPQHFLIPIIPLTYLEIPYCHPI